MPWLLPEVPSAEMVLEVIVLLEELEKRRMPSLLEVPFVRIVLLIAVDPSDEDKEIPKLLPPLVPFLTILQFFIVTLSTLLIDTPLPVPVPP